MSPVNGAVQRKSLLVVAPKRSNITSKDFKELRDVITRNPDLQFIVGIVAELEALWATIVVALPDLRDVRGDEQLRWLHQFLEGGDGTRIEASAAQHQNVSLDVVNVIFQIVEFWRLATTSVGTALFSSSDARPTSSLEDIQGFCLGFLTAAAVSSARAKAEFEQTTATVLRIAVCIGALVELDDLRLRGSGSEPAFASVAWDSPDGYSTLKEVLSTYPDVRCTKVG